MFLYPLGLLALAAAPAIVGIYLFRRRFRPKTVSALYLWESRDRAPIAGRKRERLRSSASLWLELAAAVALALIIAGLRMPGFGETGHLVVVLDGSASMAATPKSGSLRERAIAEIRGRIAALPPRAVVSILVSGTKPELLAGPAAFTGEASAKLDAFQPRAPRHDLAASIALASQISGGASVLLVTDRYAPDAVPASVEVVALGSPADNMGFVQVARSRSQNAATGAKEERVFLTIANFSDRTASTTLRLKPVGGAVLASRQIELASGERRSLRFEIPDGSPALEARIDPDALEIDNCAYLAPPPSRIVAITSTLESGEAVRLGLSTGGSSAVDRWKSLATDVVDAGSADPAHLVFGRAATGGDRTWCVLLDAQGKERRDFVGPFLADRRHPLLDGLTLEGSVWSCDPDLALDGFPLVSAGDLPILTEIRDGHRRVFHLNIDPIRSTIPRSPDWPIFLTNLLESRRSELPGPLRTTIALGETFTYRGAEARRYVLKQSDPSKPVVELAARQSLVFDGFREPGLHLLELAPSESAPIDRKICEIGVSFLDDAIADLRTLSSGKRPSSAEQATARAGFTWVDALLLLAVAAALALDWWILRRKAAQGGETA